MALTTPQTNNKLVQYRKELVREFVRENMFSPYMGDSPNSIIRTLHDPKKGGEHVNIPLVRALSGAAKSTQPTTPATKSASDAKESRKSVSASVCAAWTSTVRSTPARRRTGRRSSAR